MYHAISAGHVERLIALFPAWIGATALKGGMGVAVFFVLSGFVIAHSLYGRPMSFGEFGRFTLRRSLRLDPAYWASIALTIALAVLSSYLVAGKQMPDYSVSQVVVHIFYLQDVLQYPAISAVYWTLCLEIQFYLVYALLMSVGGSQARWIVGACIISLLWPLGLVPDVWPGLFVSLWYGFLLGVAAYWAWREPKMAPLFWIYAAILMVVGMIRENDFAVVCSATALFLFGTAVSGRITSGLNWRWLQFLGLISYSLYLTHNQVTGVVFRVAAIIGGHSALGDLVWWIVSLLACVVFATVFWWLVERPSMELAKRIGKRKDSVSPPQSAAPIAVQHLAQQ